MQSQQRFAPYLKWRCLKRRSLTLYPTELRARIRLREPTAMLDGRQSFSAIVSNAGNGPRLLYSIPNFFESVKHNFKNFLTLNRRTANAYKSQYPVLCNFTEPIRPTLRFAVGVACSFSRFTASKPLGPHGISARPTVDPPSGIGAPT